MVDETSGHSSVTRRTLLAGVSAAGAAAFAGCQGSPDGNSSNSDDPQGGNQSGSHGERVPQLEIAYMTGVGDSTTIMENSLPTIQQNVQDALGIQVNSFGLDISTYLSENYDDWRGAHISFHTIGNSLKRLDPNVLLTQFHAENAGANGRPNYLQYVNCEYSDLANQQSNASNPEERRDIVYDALGIMSDDVGPINLFDRNIYGAIRTDQISLENAGPAGVTKYNPEAILSIQPLQSDTRLSMNVGGGAVTSLNHLTINNTGPEALWNQLIYSSLVRWNKNYEIENSLASDYTIEDDFRKITFSLKDATFHNGEPITSEDVKWTLEFITGNQSTFPRAREWPIDSINAIDDSTVEFTFSEPSPSFLNTAAATWGILPKDHWVDAGAEENPTDPNLNEVIGSGPYQIANFEPGQILQLEPYNDHWNTPDAPLDLKLFQSATSAFNAFQEGTLNINNGVPPGIANEIKEMDNARTVLQQGFTGGYLLAPQMSFGPGKFREFRMALSQSLNRNELVQVAYYGDSDPLLHSCIYGPRHPFYPDDDEGLTKIAESPEANPERAKQILRDNGWTFDSQGRLHYPADADLSPVWPEGETPSTDEFPCIEN
ncbi:ABC transporter substrate-binding protein [Halopenitus persicus]|uniref:ABC transporter substrate-binding protein n=1 Tax=Halopenitus persicus TaxID=1048396 RepID=UPI0012FD3D56|nr:ABC transporter substrate-binding protein [Halopenitus persicus]